MGNCMASEAAQEQAPSHWSKKNATPPTKMVHLRPAGTNAASRPPAPDHTAAPHGQATGVRAPMRPTQTHTTNSVQAPAKAKPIIHRKKTANLKGQQPTHKPNLRKTGINLVNKVDDEDPFSSADSSKWRLSELNYAGSAVYETLGQQEQIKGKSIETAIADFKANPLKYLAIYYQKSMLDWPVANHAYTLVYRADTKGYKPVDTSPTGWMTILLQEYERLPPYPDHTLPVPFRDAHTDHMTHNGRKLHSTARPPLMPGRGMGIGDAPHLKIIGDVDPSDIKQGSVGDCWLLSGISSLAEFDGAVKRLFRKTKQLDHMPLDGPNKYTVTLWDLSTWKEVDVVVDERLCTHPQADGQLLGAKPSDDGELWVCYLEKALAIHCGGWDRITGGQCTHAWALLTGCKDQYTIRLNESTGNTYACYGKRWEQQGGNSPHDNAAGGMWHVKWPRVGGGGAVEKEIGQEELFMKMCAWDDVNYIVGASTNGTSDKNRTDGIVDNHAYSVIECINDVAGTDIDLIKVRNPWGKGEIEDGLFDDDGPGWDQYPQIKKALNPVVADDGIFWVTKQEFFQYFQTIYLSASNMTEFLED